MKENEICFKCGNSSGMECFNENEYVCKQCRTYYKLSEVTPEEMIEWFVV